MLAERMELEVLRKHGEGVLACQPLPVTRDGDGPYRGPRTTLRTFMRANAIAKRSMSARVRISAE
jgi:hypothetical protein